jgi:uncharacterized RDD family membrane protein YckC
LLLFALFLVAGFAILPIIGSSPTGTVYTAPQLYVLPDASRAFLFFFYVALGGAYCIGFWSHGRRTLAMKTWGLALEMADGRPVDIRHATKRYFAAWIGAAAALIGFWLVGGWGLAAALLNYYWGWMDTDGHFLHDRIAGTRIIRH